jgi:hypothetical protein
MSNWNDEYPNGGGESYAEHFFGKNASYETFLKALFGGDLTNPNVNIEHISAPLNNVTDLDQFLNNPDNNNFLTQYRNITYTLAKAFPELAFAIRSHTPKHLLIFGRINGVNGKIGNRIGSLFFGIKNINKKGQINISIDNNNFGNNKFYFRHFVMANFHNQEIGLDPPIEFEFNKYNEVVFDEKNDIFKIIDDEYKELVKKYDHDFHTKAYTKHKKPPFYPSNCRDEGIGPPPPPTETNPNGETKNSMQSLNQILYGPPGTGKTYNTVTKALGIIDPENAKKEYPEQLTRFNELKAEGRIEFITFHQSFSYEDFIEGIRAETTKDGNLNYVIKDGVFKKIATEALFSKLTEDERNLAWEGLKVEDNEGKPLVFNQNNYEHKKKILVTRKLQDYKEDTGQPYVLIIDEINRGNMSRIFGELITLVETTKRAGSDEAMDAILPYSQDKFTVPDNLYIIGTMNTADQSLARIDIALRRRFDFEEKMPEPSELKNKDGTPLKVGKIDIQAMLKAINIRIEVLHDREHTIGHAFFMKLANEKKSEKEKMALLESIFKNNILPLLEEYFFEDWEKITQVLGASKIYVPNPDIQRLKLGNDRQNKCFIRDYKTLKTEQTYLDIIKDKVNQE